MRTLSHPLSPVKSAVVGTDGTATEVTDDTGPQPGLQTRITAPTPASSDNEAVLIAIRSLIPTTAEPRTTRRRSGRESNDSRR